jgi:hypothetical protein
MSYIIELEGKQNIVSNINQVVWELNKHCSYSKIVNNSS